MIKKLLNKAKSLVVNVADQYNPKASLGGYVRWEMVDPDSGQVERQGEHKNLITDVGLDLCARHAFAYNMRYCFVGNGAATSANSDLRLQGDYVKATNRIITGNCREEIPSTDEGASPASIKYVIQFEFTLGEVSGQDLHEVGFGYHANSGVTGESGSNNTLFSRSLFKDDQGNPTPINVPEDKLLRITYELTISFPSTEQEITLDFGGTIGSVRTRIAVGNVFIESHSNPSSTSSAMAGRQGKATNTGQYWGEPSFWLGQYANGTPNTGTTNYSVYTGNKTFTSIPSFPFPLPIGAAYPSNIFPYNSYGHVESTKNSGAPGALRNGTNSNSVSLIDYSPGVHTVHFHFVLDPDAFGDQTIYAVNLGSRLYANDSNYNAPPFFLMAFGDKDADGRNTGFYKTDYERVEFFMQYSWGRA